MKVILKQDVKTLGKSGAIVEVNEGYANNFLFPRSLAVPATGGALNAKATQDKTQAVKEAKALEAAQEQAKVLAAKPIVITSKVGEGGKLYGTVTNKDIATALKQQAGFEFDKHKIHLADPIKAVGEFLIEIQIHPKVKTKIQLHVQASS